MQTLPTIERTFTVAFAAEVGYPFIKAYETDGDLYVVVKASDTSVDRDNERIAPELIGKMKQLAKQGRIKFLDNHKATLELGVVVDYEEHTDDPHGFYPIIRLNKDHPFVPFLFKKIKEGSANYGVSIGGRNPKVRVAYDQQLRRPIVEIVDADIDHVALTREGYAANPNTGIVRAIIKEVGEEPILEMAEELLKQVTEATGSAFTSQAYPMGPVTVSDVLTTAPGDEEKPTGRGKRKVAGKKAMDEQSKDTQLEAKEVSDEQFVAEMSQAVELARSTAPTTVAFEREKQHGYRGVYICPVKPPAWAAIPDHLFADPVGYFYPMTKERFGAAYRHFLKHWEQLYTPTAAVKVYERFVRKAVEYGFELSFNDAPLLASKLPADAKTLLSDYDPTKAAQLEQLFDLYEAVSIRNHIKGVALNPVKLIDKERESKALEVVKERAAAYERAVPLDATVEEVLLDVNPRHYADPVTPRYLLTNPTSVYYSLIHFEQNQHMYPPRDQLAVYTALVKAARSFGIAIPFNPDNPLHWLLPDNLKQTLVGYELYKDEDTEQKRQLQYRMLDEAWKQFWQEHKLPQGAAFAQQFWKKLPPEATAPFLPEPKKEEQPQERPSIENTTFVVAVPTRTKTLQAFQGMLHNKPSDRNAALDDFVYGMKWRVDAIRNRLVGKADDGEEVVITIEKQAGVAQVKGTGRRISRFLADALMDALERATRRTGFVLEAISTDAAIVRNSEGEEGPYAHYAFRWWIDPATKEVRVGGNLIKVRVAYVPEEYEQAVYDLLLSVLEETNPKAV